MVAGILALKQRDRRGVDTLPRAVAVRIGVGGGSVEVIRRFVDDPELDRDVEADLLNRLAGVRAEALPVRHYDVRQSEEIRVEVEPMAREVLVWLVIEGGDRGGTCFAFQASAVSCRMGRGAWHGRQDTLANELVVSDHDHFVSRRAAVLYRAGSGLEVESLDQGDCLAIVRTDGKRLRPTHVPRRRVRVRPGDVIELNDGGQQAIRLRVSGEEPAAAPAETGADGNSS